MVEKRIELLGKAFQIEGIGPDDPYFQGLADHADADFSTLITELLPSQAVAFDIGANIGITACLLSRHLNTGRVVAFEPSKSVFPVLHRNIERNKLANVEGRNVAIGAEQGTLGFVGESAYGHLTSDGGGDAVPVDTIDDVVTELALDRLDLIKIDVEGFEDNVLAGGTEAEKRFRPLYYMEFNAFCIAAYRQRNPYDFAAQVLGDFEHVFLVGGDGSLERLPPDAAHLLHTNIVHEGSVSNLLMTNDEQRLQPQTAGPNGAERSLAQALELSRQENAQILSETEKLRAERDHARRYPWKYLRSALRNRRR